MKKILLFVACLLSLGVGVYAWFFYKPARYLWAKPFYTQRVDNTSYSFYPSAKDVDSCVLENSISTKNITIDSLKSCFDNLNDMDWLKPIAQNNKVIYLGEDHYYSACSYIRNKMLFALNTFDYYPLIILEHPYSRTPFVNYYVSIEDDVWASQYKEKIKYMAYVVEDWDLYESIRQWNKTHPTKKISIAFFDKEHDCESIAQKILIPYLKQLDKDLPQRFITHTYLEKFLDFAEKLLVTAKAQDLKGENPLITAQYIENVIQNIRDSYLMKGWTWGTSVYDSTRHVIMVRNLTDKKYLGNYLITSKVMIYGGWNHCDLQKSKKEAYYLWNEFAPTKGKVFTIKMNPLSMYLDKMKNVSLDTNTHLMHTGYKGLINPLQKLYREGKIGGLTPVMLRTSCYSPLNEVDKLMIKQSYKYPQTAFVIEPIAQKKIDSLQKVSKDAYEHLTDYISTNKGFHRVIVIPQSPICEAME